MAPAVTVDNPVTTALAPSKPSTSTVTPRTLLLSPPSLSSHPESLENVLAAHDRSMTDIQMLDRLAMSLVSLPTSTYDLVLLLADPDASQSQDHSLLSKSVFNYIYKSLKPGAKVQFQDEKQMKNDHITREAILAGFLVENDEMLKPNEETTQSVPLRTGRKNGAKASTSAVGTGAVTLNLNGKRKNGPPDTGQPAGVGFVDYSNGNTNEDTDDSDDELIDENTLLDEEDMKKTVVQPPECRPKQGKRRRACKDCTCGLAQKLEAEDRQKRSNADAQLAKLQADDLAEVDFTIQGKVGSCGNCALGDAFRCDGCPYIGLPAFKSGEEVRLLNDDVQL